MAIINMLRIATMSLFIQSAFSIPLTNTELSSSSDLGARGNTDPCPEDKGTYSTVLRDISGLYSIEVKINGIPRYLWVDTGSSDIWIFTEKAQCLNAKGTPVATSTCAFGEPYIGTFDPINGTNFLQTYGNGESVSGAYAYADVEVAGMNVEQQQVAFVDKAYWQGNRVVSGVIGLASRFSEGAYPGNNVADDEPNNMVQYSPLIETVINTTKQIDPIFSVAYQRGGNNGYLTFGGLPPINFQHDFVTAKLTGVRYNGTNNSRRFYPIVPQSFELNGETHSTSYTAIIDTGTAACRLPQAVAEKINGAFDPPAIYDASLGYYITSCNATVPKLGFGIGGKVFQLDQADIFPFISHGEKCATSILNAYVPPSKAYPDGLYAFGDNFLKNVVAVFDLGNEELRFAPHSSY